MAIMIPDQPPGEGGGKLAERMLYEALRDGLSDEYFVYHSLRYLEGGRASEGEVDFLVLHRTEGMLVIECKGRGVELKQDGYWYRMEGHLQKRMTKTPDQQAQKQVRDLEAELKVRMLGVQGMDPRRLPFAFGYAVALPRRERLSQRLPLSLQPEILYTGRDLVRMGERVKATMAFWRKAAGKIKALDEPGFNRFRGQVLHPELAIVSCLGADMAAEAQQMHRLSKEQAKLLDGFLHNRELTVAGGAGSGKTLMALEAARLLACQGRSVLLLCYNRALGRFLGRCVDALETGQGSVRARHFHGVCADAWRDHGEGAFQVPRGKEAQVEFWDNEAPVMVLEALDAGALEHVDDVVVDEGQDFHASWWDVVKELRKDKEDGRLFIFHDSAQEIFGRELSIPGEAAPFHLTRNYRNTLEIANVVHRLGRVNMSPCERCPQGKAPSVYRQGSPRNTRKQLDALLVQLLGTQGVLPDQVTILTPHTRKNSTLAGVEELAGVRLATLPNERDGKLLHTTIGAFKGLESDVVIMLDIDPKDERCGPNARYVAASRARHRLYVFAKGDWLADSPCL